MTESHHDHAKCAHSGSNAPGTVIDPVCGMSVDSATTTHVATHDGAHHYFCSAACLAKFKADGYLSADNAVFTDLPVDMISFGASNVQIKVGNADDPLFTIDGIDLGGVAAYLGAAEGGNLNLFI